MGVCDIIRCDFNDIPAVYLSESLFKSDWKLFLRCIFQLIQVESKLGATQICDSLAQLSFRCIDVKMQKYSAIALFVPFKCFLLTCYVRLVSTMVAMYNLATIKWNRAKRSNCSLILLCIFGILWILKQKKCIKYGPKYITSRVQFSDFLCKRDWREK